MHCRKMAIKNVNIWGIIYTRHCKMPTMAMVIKIRLPSFYVLSFTDQYTQGNSFTEIPTSSLQVRACTAFFTWLGKVCLSLGYKNILIQYPLQAKSWGLRCAKMLYVQCQCEEKGQMKEMVVEKKGIFPFPFALRSQF